MVTQRNLLKRKTPKRFIMKHFGVLQVVPPGIEPGTQGFSVLYLIGNFMVTQRNLLKRKTPKRFIMKHFGVLQVVPPGIEPGTQGFSVLCSTN